MPADKRIKRILITALSVIFAAAIIYLLYKDISKSDYESISRSINPAYLLAAFVFHSLAYFTRSWRFTVQMRDADKDYGLVLSIHTVHNFINHILPFSTGELSFPFLLKKYSGRDFVSGTALLINTRIYDVFVYSIFLFVSLFFIDSLRPHIGILLTLNISLILLCVLLIFLPARILMKFTFGNPGNFITRKWNKFVSEFSGYNMERKIPALALSFVSNMLIFGVFWSILNGMNISLNYFQTSLAATIFFVTYIFPIRGIAGFGTTEGGWTLSLMLLGIDQKTGSVVALFLHIFVLISSAVVAGIGLLYLTLHYGKKTKNA